MTFSLDLPDATAMTHGGGDPFPLFIEPTSTTLCSSPAAAAEWFVEQRPTLDALVTDIGAVVLRNFPLTETRHFGALVASYPTLEFGYSAGVTPRGQIEGNVFEATNAPPQFRIPLHQEMSYLPQYPAKLAFFCKNPSTTGGETIVGDMRRFDRLLRPEFRAAIAELGVLYERNFRSPDWSTGHPVLDARHRPWADAFGTTDPSKVEADCAAMGLQFEWQDDGSLTTRFRGPSVVTHPDTGRDVWFNQLVQQATNVENLGQDLFDAYAQHYTNGRARPFEVYFGDGTEVLDDVSSAYPLLDEITVAFPWQAGDVMFVDNLNTAHGRNTFTGERDIQVALLGRDNV